MLTIGEGLVSQIPALVISTSAGIIVTRVASEEEGGHLGRDIGLQMMAQPKAIAIAAGLLALLAIVPGLPGRAVPHAGAWCWASIAWRLLRTPAGAPATAAERRAVPGAARPRGAPRPRARAGEAAPAPVLTPDRRRGGGRARRAARAARRRATPARSLAEVVPRVRERLFAELGLPLPVVRLRPRRRRAWRRRRSSSA